MLKFGMTCLLSMTALLCLFVVNTTPSFPRGVYLKTYQTPRKGDLVLFCPPDAPLFHDAMRYHLLSSGLCLSGFGYLLKRIAAVEGDIVGISAAGVEVNGMMLKNSERQTIFHPRPLTPDMHRRLKAHEVLLMSPHPLSFDSRYFGPLSDDCICTPLEPFYLLEE